MHIYILFYLNHKNLINLNSQHFFDKFLRNHIESVLLWYHISNLANGYQQLSQRLYHNYLSNQDSQMVYIELFVIYTN